jgi:hypothetical protein
LSSASSRGGFLTGTASATPAPDARELVVLFGLDVLAFVETGDGGTAPVFVTGKGAARKGLGCSSLVFGTLGVGLDGGSSSESVYIGDVRLLSLTWPDRLMVVADAPLVVADFAGLLVCAWLEPTLALPFTFPFEVDVVALRCAGGRFFPTVDVVGMLPFARTGGEPLASEMTAFFALPFAPVAVSCPAGVADVVPVDVRPEFFFCCLRSSRMSQSSSSWLIFATLPFPFPAVAPDPVVLEDAGATATASSNSSSMVDTRAFFAAAGVLVAPGSAGFFPFVVAVAAAISSASTARAAPRLELATSTAAKRSASAVEGS